MRGRLRRVASYPPYRRVIVNTNMDEKKPAPAVTIYTTPTCGFCHMAKDYFEENGIEYTERDITVDEEGLKYVLETIGQAATPVITIGDEIIVGFDRPKIEAALATLK
jgi:glutaredoxin 3